MLLRSTGHAKRGLGTIRQDVNVSIAEGARIELKGVQSLDDIDDIVRNEVRRQVELLDIKSELAEREAAVGDPQNVTDVFEDTDSGVIGGALSSGGEVEAVRLEGFDGPVGREIQPDRRLGTEFSDHAKAPRRRRYLPHRRTAIYGVTGGRGHRPACGRRRRHRGRCRHRRGRPPDRPLAIEAVADRARTAMEGIPEETRGANDDATSRYLRPLPARRGCTPRRTCRRCARTRRKSNP